jgi:hypothetical protein
VRLLGGVAGLHPLLRDPVGGAPSSDGHTAIPRHLAQIRQQVWVWTGRINVHEPALEVPNRPQITPATARIEEFELILALSGCGRPVCRPRLRECAGSQPDHPKRDRWTIFCASVK